MIDFNGCKQLGNNIDTIEIESDGNLWDLHNACEFVEFIYNTLERILILVWHYYDYDSGKISNKIQMKLYYVTMLKIDPRDSDMPFGEDTCLEKLVYYSDKNRLIFQFRGGIMVDVICTKLDFKILTI